LLVEKSIPDSFRGADGKLHMKDLVNVQKNNSVETTEFTVLSFPDIEVNDGESLLEFFKAMGWDGEVMLNPVKIKVNPKRWKEMCEGFTNLTDKFSFMNYGPSAKDSVPYDEVHMYEGAFIKEA
jgi:hypothetical protein